jgi:hypothetical protein
MQNYIAEWASPNFHHAEYLPFLLIVLATFAVLSWSRLQVRARDLLLLLVSLYAGLCSIRLIPLFILIVVPWSTLHFAAWLENRSNIRLENRRTMRIRPRPSRLGAHAVLNSLIVTAMAVFAGVHVVRVIQQQPQAEMQIFPTRAVTFLQAHPARGPIFNHYDWGGYLIWKLYPSIRVFIDGRADLYGEQIFHQFADAYQFKGAWREALQQWSVNTVLVPADSALAVGLQSAPDWMVSYADPQAVVLTLAPVEDKPSASGTTVILKPGL